MNAAMRQTRAEMPQVRGSLLRDEPMAAHCTWRAGGRVDWLFEPADREDLLQLLSELDPAVPVTWIGLGSNLLVRDGGLRGVAIAPLKGLKRIEEVEPGLLRAEAGVSCARLARQCAAAELSGLDFMAGIPGTVGGALAMNAGAFGGETWERVESVETVDRSGELRRRDRAEFKVAYRQVEKPVAQEWFLSADFRLPPRGTDTGAEIKSLLQRRNQSQPVGQPSCGSVFRNPPGDHAARLIEACGLKGHCIGDACVSEKHANFIINTGSARAVDIEKLIELLRDRVEQKFGIRLMPEVHIIGEAEERS